MSTTVAAHRAAERWFLDRGLPSVLTPRARLQAVWSRSAPFLAATATVDVCSLVTYQMVGGVDFVGAPPLVQRIGLVVTLLALPVTAVVGWVVARMVADHGQAIVSTVASVIGVGSQAVKGHTSQDHLARLVEGLVAVPAVVLLTAVGPIEDLKVTLLARNRYLNNLSARQGADQVAQVAERELGHR